MSWIPRLFRALPGPLRLRIGLFSLIAVVALVGLHFFYQWLGNAILDSGGTVE